MIRGYLIAVLLAALVGTWAIEELRLARVRADLVREQGEHARLKDATKQQNDAVEGLAGDARRRALAAARRVERALKDGPRAIPPGAGPEEMNRWLSTTLR